ncbi:hypothetical protein LEP1GSC199_1848 [Leptospira vanthielii serovar Holland str. Waz Holland = ATCC 700522]|uniref:Uncharacterized protein n=1 Tax=Leptospira vanthielii serovar Holland str. Waz Holland = ATCC 700522 TaxID=1218591 RepID=N1WA53_9LEPT|nr:hypothetical protein LEP1GSC199_1848 [Leptospira vanthielii serovar Holland str. Waz Holland = ATCC 700522]
MRSRSPFQSLLLQRIFTPIGGVGSVSSIQNLDGNTRFPITI